MDRVVIFVARSSSELRSYFLLFVQIEHAGLGVAFGQKRPALSFPDQPLESSLGEVAEDSSIGGTGDHTGRFQTSIDAVGAKVALAHGAFIKFGKLDRFIRTQSVGTVPMLE